MNKKAKIILFITFIIIIIIVSIFIMIIYNKNIRKEETKEESQAPTEATQLINEEDKRKEDASKELDEKMKSILVGVLTYSNETEEKYNDEKVNNILNNFKKMQGLYLSERARKKVLELLELTTSIKYVVDEDGYLKNYEKYETNEISKEINKLINGDKIIIIDYNPYYYCKLGEDICTFNIEKTAYMEKFKKDETTILILNSEKYEQEYESNIDLVYQIINNV